MSIALHVNYFALQRCAMCFGWFNYIPLLTERIVRKTVAINILLLRSNDPLHANMTFRAKPPPSEDLFNLNYNESKNPNCRKHNGLLLKLRCQLNLEICQPQVRVILRTEDLGDSELDHRAEIINKWDGILAGVGEERMDQKLGVVINCSV